MSQVIIYIPDAGGVAVIYPAPEALSIYGIDQIAQKDVPAGKPYKIIDAGEVPADRTFRAAWTIEEALLTDGVGAEYDTVPEVGHD